MSGPTVMSSGTRGIAAGRDISGIAVSGDNNTLLVVPGGEAGTLLERLRGAPRVTPRPSPVRLLPPQFSDHLGRDVEVRELRTFDGPALSVVGPAGVGKSYVISAAYGRRADDDAGHIHDAPGHPPTARSDTASSIVHLRQAQRPLPDLLQSVWETFYDSDPPTVADAHRLRSDLADRDALVILEVVDLDHGDTQELAGHLPASRVVVVDRDRRWWDGDELRIGGLNDEDASALLVRELARQLGHVVTPDEEPAARVVCRAVRGHPVLLKRAVTALGRGRSLPELAAELEQRADASTVVASAAFDAGSPKQRDLLSVLAAFDGEPVGVGLLEALLGPGTGAVAAGMVDRGLLRRGSPRYGLALPDDLARHPARPTMERTVDRALQWAASASAGELDAEVDPLVALWRRLREHDEHAMVVALGQALVPALVRTRRFGSWRTVVDQIDVSAAVTGDTAAQAWARHEAGTHAVATGDRRTGVELLRDARDLRRTVDDRAGIRATRHNLRLAGARVVWWPDGPRGWLNTLLFLAVVVAVGLVWWPPGDDVEDADELVTDSDIDADEDVADHPDDDADDNGTGNNDGTGDEAEGSDVDEGERDDTTPGEPDDEDPGSDDAGPGDADDDQTGDNGPGDDRTGDNGPGDDRTDDNGPGENGPDDNADDGPGTNEPDEPAEPETWTVTVDVEGDGAGRVVGEAAGIACPDDCEAAVEDGDELTIAATAGEGSLFTGWEPEDTCDDVQPTDQGVSSCTFSPSQDVTVTARFDPAVVLSVTLDGPGAVSVEPMTTAVEPATSSVEQVTGPCVSDAVDGAEACGYELPAGTPVTLTAEGRQGWTFIGWRDQECEDTDPCTFVLEGDRDLAAVFARPNRLLVDVRGPGRVVTDPAGVDCKGTNDTQRTERCEADFPIDRVVTLRAQPDDRAYLHAWTGDCEQARDEVVTGPAVGVRPPPVLRPPAGLLPDTNRCRLSLDQPRTAGAVFNAVVQ
jgi:hypothetical protein